MGAVISIFWFFFIAIIISKEAKKKSNNNNEKSSNISQTKQTASVYKKYSSQINENSGVYKYTKVSNTNKKSSPNMNGEEEALIYRLSGSSSKLNGGQRCDAPPKDIAQRGRLSKESRADEKQWFK